MPRGRRRSSPAVIFGTRRFTRADRRLFSVLIVVGGLALVVHSLSSVQGAVFASALRELGAGVVIIGAALWGLRLLVRAMAVSHVREAIDRAVIEHEDALIRRRAQLVTVDAYGTPQMERWYGELQHFLASQVTPHLSGRGRMIVRQREREFVISVSQRIAENMKGRPAFSSLRSNATGAEFEAYCADKLRSTGWDAHVTKGARDQGVDVIATKNGVRIVLQCKLHSRPIGNKAVQEAFAGKNFERANYAAVVSATAYTRDAEQLAQTNGVLLLHHTQLEQLDSMLGLARPETT